jgi:hypothetical protein
MTERRNLKVYGIAFAVGVLWAALISRYIELGPPRYWSYRASSLCQQVKPGMSVQSVVKTIPVFGQARSATLLGEHVIVEGTDVMCVIQLNSARTEVINTSVSELPIIN